MFLSNKQLLRMPEATGTNLKFKTVRVNGMLGTSMPCLAEWGSGLNKNVVFFGERLLFVGAL